MKRSLTFAVLAMAAMSLCAQTAEMFKPYKSTSLRLPSVPIVVNDPYFSIWSPYDELNAGTTRHWTDAEKPLDGLLRVDGTTYRFLGVEKKLVLERTLLPMADEVKWEGRTSFEYQPDKEWTKENFDDTSWEVKTGAFGTAKEYPYVSTKWEDENSDVYVRRTMKLTAEDIKKDLYIMYSHDDVFELYINGVKLVSTGETWLQGETYHITNLNKRFLKEGDNIVAAHCHNTTGGAYLDFGVYVNSKTSRPDIQKAVQKSVDVLATNTYYTFECGPVELDVVFTAPMLLDDLDLLSTPINYVSYQVRSIDGNEHDVQFYLATSPELAVNDKSQETMSRRETADGHDFAYLKAGTTEQPVLKKAGDIICIDWGFVYLPEINGKTSLALSHEVENVFATEGKLPQTKRTVTSSNTAKSPTLAYVHDFGKVTTGSSFAMIGYDEVWDMIYMHERYKGYWARNGKTILQAFEEMRDNYTNIMQRCRDFDKMVYDHAMAAGNEQYAEILCGSYRHVIAAHKLFEDNKGNLLFFSKENNSNGCVNTVDLTYPEAPLFLMYNPELQKAMMTAIFEYCRSDKWGFPFAAHDIGTYPHANGQVYSITRPDHNGGFAGNMPIEEAGNMVTLTATISMLDGNTSYAERYWDTLKQWTDYLVEHGQDPGDQLCTDDFAGHSTHNSNLSIKAIMGVAGFAEMCRIKGDADEYQTYMSKARTMAEKWEQMANAGDHYSRTFDLKDTWSQKYNIVWDKLWDINIFPSQVITRELDYYLTKQNRYGLPLDNRATYTKSDWIMWTAALSPDKATFLKFVDPMYKYINETRSRVPISDWYDTISGNWVSFRARSVIGGHWMKVLMDNFDKDNPQTGIDGITSNQTVKDGRTYTLQGIEVKDATRPGVYIRDGKKFVVK